MEIECHGKIVKIDGTDYELFCSHNWYLFKGRNTDYLCTNIRVDGKRRTAYLHRILLGCAKGECIDHIDGNGLNNQRDNLRACSRSENQCNQIKNKNTSSIYKGVSWNRNKQRWECYINKNHKRVHIGKFKSEIEAAIKWDEQAKILHGEFARLNF